MANGGTDLVDGGGIESGVEPEDFWGRRGKVQGLQSLGLGGGGEESVEGDWCGYLQQVGAVALFCGFDGKAVMFFQLAAAFPGFDDCAVGGEPLDAGNVELGGLFDQPVRTVGFGHGDGDGQGGGWRRVGGDRGSEFEEKRTLGGGSDQGGCMVALAVEENYRRIGGETKNGERVMSLVIGKLETRWRLASQTGQIEAIHEPKSKGGGWRDQGGCGHLLWQIVTAKARSATPQAVSVGAGHFLRACWSPAMVA